jgi:ribosome biogenesis GTPase / thiamine phosphate phosphatase
VRPGRGSRPRTKTRPAHASAVIGFVFAVDRGRYSCMVGGRSVVAMKARELGRGSVVVGDQVALAGDVSGSAGSLARIVRVLDRSSVLRRSADDSDPVERVIVANADQMLIVCALASPPPRLRFVDRCLVAAYDAGLAPVLVLTKADLASSASVRSVYGPLDMPMIDTQPGSLGVLPSLLSDRISVLIGQSGVGKSTLVNALVPSAVRSVGSVNPVTGRGRHTSSSAVAFEYGDSGWLIDTPGLRGFGLGHVSVERVVEAFGDLAPGLEDCPPGCDHVSPGCGLDAALADAAAGDAAPGVAAPGVAARLDSLRRLLASRSGAPDTDLARLRARMSRACAPPAPLVTPVTLFTRYGHLFTRYRRRDRDKLDFYCRVRVKSRPGRRAAGQRALRTGRASGRVTDEVGGAAWAASDAGGRGRGRGAGSRPCRPGQHRNRPGDRGSSRRCRGPRDSSPDRGRGQTGSRRRAAYAWVVPPLRQ